MIRFVLEKTYEACERFETQLSFQRLYIRVYHTYCPCSIQIPRLGHGQVQSATENLGAVLVVKKDGYA